MKLLNHRENKYIEKMGGKLVSERVSYMPEDEEVIEGK